MDLVGYGAGLLLELADDEGVDVFVGGAVEEAGQFGIGEDGIEGSDDLGALGGGEDADLFESAREGLGAADIGVEQAPVEIERAGEALEDFGRAGFETSSPEFHLDLPVAAGGRRWTWRRGP